MGKLIRCPVCRESFDLDFGLEIGDNLDCPGCAAELKLVRLNPAEVEEVFEPWGDDQDDEDEE